MAIKPGAPHGQHAGYARNARSPYGVAVCKLCGRPLPIQRRGRPRMFHPECYRIESFLSTAEAQIGDEAFRMTRGAASALRARLWFVANQVNANQDPPSDPSASARSTPWRPPTPPPD